MYLLVPIDGSEAASRAVEFAAKLVAEQNSNLIILVVRQYTVGRHVTAATRSEEDIDRLLDKSRKLAMWAGCKQVAIAQLTSRDIAYAIVNFAEEQKVDLIVMGASGMGGFKAFLIGSISAEVLRKSVCPVTIVH